VGQLSREVLQIVMPPSSHTTLQREAITILTQVGIQVVEFKDYRQRYFLLKGGIADDGVFEWRERSD